MTFQRTEIQGYEQVRRAARDYASFSSDLQGDRDVRSYRQLPLESDPPRHTVYRELIQPIFLRTAVEPLVPAFASAAERLIRRFTQQGGGDFVRSVGLPYVVECLTVLYGRPQDLDEWISWGPDVWLADAYRSGELNPESQKAHRERRFDGQSQRSGERLHAYLESAFDEAARKRVTDPEHQDAWDKVSQLRIDGEPLSREQMYGYASVMLAGGRDTVLKLVTGLVWHLVATPADRAPLADDPRTVGPAINELVRFLTPLAKMERVHRADGSTPESPSYTVLNFATANHDPRVWEEPGRVDIHRERRAHLGFGAGRHSCLGMNVAELETRAFLGRLLDPWPGWTFDGPPAIVWASEGDGETAVRVIDRFERLDLQVSR